MYVCDYARVEMVTSVYELGCDHSKTQRDTAQALHCLSSKVCVCVFM